MSSIVHSAVEIQISPEKKAAVPSWFEEVILVARYLQHHHLLTSLAEHVRFSRARMGTFELIDFVVVLLGYALSGERTLHDFYQRLSGYEDLFMALFGRAKVPHRCTLSRFLAALSPDCVTLLRKEVLADLGARPWPEVAQAGWWDRGGSQWSLFDVDGTRATARQRALPQAAHLPPAHRRHEQVCAKGYTGRKRGEVVRTRTTVLHSTTCQWVGTFSGAGNGHPTEELVRAVEAIIAFTTMRSIPRSSVLVRLDGLYGSGAYMRLFHEAGLGCVLRGKDYGLLNDPAIQARLAQPPDATLSHAETGSARWLYDCAAVRLPSGPVCRVIIATHLATTPKPAVGVIRQGRVHELFYSTLPQEGFMATDVVEVYRHRGAFELVLADEDQEQEPDRWCSHTPGGQEFWQLLSQWVWNLRLELGHLTHPTAVRTTLFAPAVEPALAPPTAAAAEEPAEQLMRTEQASIISDEVEPASVEEPAPVEQSHPPLRWARAARPGLFAGADFTLQANGTVRCPADQLLTLRERRQGPDGTLRLFFMASAASCEACHQRAHCLRNGLATHSPRRVSLIQRAARPPDLPPPQGAVPLSVSLLPPLPEPPLLPPPLSPGGLPLLLKDWGRCCTRREWMRLARTHLVEIEAIPASAHGETDPAPVQGVVLTRAQRAHWRLSWQERLARNAAGLHSPRASIRLYGLPSVLTTVLHLAG